MKFGRVPTMPMIRMKAFPFLQFSEQILKRTKEMQHLEKKINPFLDFFLEIVRISHSLFEKEMNPESVLGILSLRPF